MSNHLAIATVTAALREHLSPAVKAAVDSAKVTLARPHKAPDTSSEEAALVNLYLYQVTPNAALRNLDLPARGRDGTLRQRPRTGIDLHYLLTFYGDQNDFEPERMLGNVIKTLHAQPILSRTLIEQLVGDTTNYPMLADSDLHHAVDLVKFTPIPFSLEELSKLWSVFLQTPYTLSTAYVGTAVVIEADSAPASALPVRSRRIFVDPFRSPAIERVLANDDAMHLLEADSRLYIYGSQLKGDVTYLSMGGKEFTPDVIGENLIEADLSAVSSGVVRAGAQTLSVVHYRGEPGDLRIAAESAAVAVMVHPKVDNVTVGLVTVRDDSLRDVALVINLTPAVSVGQRIEIVLNGASGPPAPSYSFVLAPTVTETSQIDVTVAAVAEGEYLFRVQVDGAMSALNTDAGGQYNSPKVVIT